ncbi:MAG TPA: DUF4870 domain-containing protein [Ignavibacteria bacterium]|nr:DUF4870 domain-containing protein [Ignavibacteria bacterium]
MDNNSANAVTEPSSDERLLAMLSHLSIFLGGIILPIILWATQKDKSKFVRFHSLQAIFYHLAFAVIIIVFVFLMVLILLVSGFGFAGFANSDNGGDMPVFMIITMVVMYGGIFLIAFSGIGYGIYLAVKSYQGKLIKIPVIGNYVYKNVYGAAN